MQRSRSRRCSPGGKLTDWGAHHVDIATWAAGKTDTGPVSIEPVMVKHPVPLRDGRPTVDDRYNTPSEFLIRATYGDGLELVIRHDTDNGILFEGSEGRIFVNRGKLKGRTIRWDPATEQIVGDDRAASFLAREPRRGYAVEG